MRHWRLKEKLITHTSGFGGFLEVWPGFAFISHFPAFLAMFPRPDDSVYAYALLALKTPLNSPIWYLQGSASLITGVKQGWNRGKI